MNIQRIRIKIKIFQLWLFNCLRRKKIPLFYKPERDLEKNQEKETYFGTYLKKGEGR